MARNRLNLLLYSRPKYYHPREWKSIRKRIIRRDGGVCVLCGAKEKLHVHHIDRNKDNIQLDNLITLCKSCHNPIHTTDYNPEILRQILSEYPHS